MLFIDYVYDCMFLDPQNTDCISQESGYSQDRLVPLMPFITKYAHVVQ